MPLTEIQERTAPPVLTYARLLRENDALIARGLGDSPEAEARAEAMDEPWYAMTAQEQRRMRGLSADLYALRDGGPKKVAMSPDQVMAWERNAAGAMAQVELGNADAALEFLRQPVPANLAPHVIPVLQARCWERLGDLETELVFLQEAERSSPTVTRAVLRVLRDLGWLEAAQEYADKIIARPEADALDLYAAASAHLLRILNLSDRDAGPTLRRMMPVLERAQAAARAALEIPGLDAAIAVALGHCYERLGNLAKAVQVYGAALERTPRNADLLVSRGLARYSQDLPAASQDFREALRSGARSIWPGYILSRQALTTGAAIEALRVARQAADCAGPAAIRAEVYETIGIAQARLGQPLDEILRNFATAQSLDPANESIRQNHALAAALAQMPTAQPPDWQGLTLHPVDAVRLRQRHSRAIVVIQDEVIAQYQAA